jgi:hypothetical protein
VHDQRSTDLAAVHHRLERPVGAVVPAHVTDLDQPAAEGDLRVDDPQTSFLAGGQRLFTENRLTGGNRGQHIFLMGRTPRRHQDGVNCVVGDQFLTGRVDGRADPIGDLLRLVQVDIGDRDDRCSGENGGEPPDVVLADHADADYSDVDRH